MRTCPKCVGFVGGDQQCCERFPKGWSVIDVERYWEDRSQHYLMAISVKRGDPPRALAWWVEYRTETIIGLFLLSGIMMLAIGIGVMFQPTLLRSPLGIVGFLPIYPLWAAAYMLWLKKRHTYSPTGLCPECGHSMPPGFKSGRCTECGEAISMTTRVRVQPIRKAIWLNSFIWLPLLCWFVWSSTFMRNSTVAIGILPNSSLIQLAVAERTFDTSAWDELQTRTLTPEDRTLLFDEILEKRRQIHFFTKSGNLGTWLQSEIIAGGLSPEELRRIRVDNWIPELLVPDHATAGVPFTAILQGEDRQDFLANSTGTVILFDGFAIDDGPFQGGETNTLWALEADSEKKSGFRHFTEPITIDEPGVHTFLAQYWLLDRPFGQLDDPVERDKEGRPIKPLNTNWMIPLTIEQEIRIAPPLGD